MSGHVHSQPIPRAVLLAAAAMIVMTVGLAFGARRARLAEAPSVAPALETLDLRFADRADGGIAILDASGGREVSAVAPRSNGFIRGVLRGMFRTRKLEALGHDGAFRLSRGADGRLALADPQTGRRVDLDSFGPTNARVFAELLVAGRKGAR